MGGVDFETDYFMDAFALSWTTFSTVGYGVVYSGTSANQPKIDECTGLTIVVTLEAFIGVLFGSFSGAIVFGKISRIQSFAQVVFSDPIVIRYGAGVDVEEGRTKVNLDEDTNHNATKGLPCPVLEFRVVNRLNGTVGGEILDATVNIVASIDASQACKDQGTNSRRRRGGKKGKKRGAMKRQALRGLRGDDDEDEEEKSENGKGPVQNFSLRRSMRTLNSNRTVPLISAQRSTQSFDEDVTGHLVPRRIFSKLEVESPDHPFFKRVWIVRHRLDENSPLLMSWVRQAVKNNRGFWPEHLNSPEGVRTGVKFDQILVSLSGTSNADANAVYAQKVYEYVDINVGYRFVNLLYRDPVDDSLLADVRLTNDVVEQNGGGGESLESLQTHQSARGSMQNMMCL